MSDAERLALEIIQNGNDMTLAQIRAMAQRLARLVLGRVEEVAEPKQAGAA